MWKKGFKNHLCTSIFHFYSPGIPKADVRNCTVFYQLIIVTTIKTHGRGHRKVQSKHRNNNKSMRLLLWVYYVKGWLCNLTMPLIWVIFHGTTTLHSRHVTFVLLWNSLQEYYTHRFCLSWRGGLKLLQWWIVFACEP